jgi:hypothetical protein
MFLLDVQAHYSISGEFVEGGQLLAMLNPASMTSDYDDRVLFVIMGQTCWFLANMVLTHVGHGDRVGYCENVDPTMAKRTSMDELINPTNLSLYPNPIQQIFTVLKLEGALRFQLPCIVRMDRSSNSNFRYAL